VSGHSTSRLPAVPPRPLVIALLSLVLQGCSTLSERECHDQDWYGIGADDGYDGAPASQIDAHRAACAEFGIEPDTEQYEAGRRDGLVQYCTVSRGFETGRDGSLYRGGCPAGSDREFLRGYDLGRRFYAVEQEMQRIDGDLRMYRSQSTTPDLGETDQRRLYTRVRDLEFERSQLEAELRQLEWERTRL
jgi:Protein of unknown function (DUF2799)